MPDILIVLFFSLVGGLFSLIGGFLLLGRQKQTERLLDYVTPFAAGALLAAAFGDILVEATHKGSVEQALHWTMVGIIAFFLVERFLRWFHHHHGGDEEKIDATVSLIIAGDTVHNFLDGIAIAAAFLINVPTGIVTTLAVAAHEIPQEIGDFGLLLKKGMSRANAIRVNIVSSMATSLAAVTFYQLGSANELPLTAALGLVAGFLIYIAVSDIFPSIHAHEDKRFAGTQTLMLVVGVIVVSVTTSLLHHALDDDLTQDSHASIHQSNN
jgi:zinc and cadmium transporter